MDTDAADAATRPSPETDDRDAEIERLRERLAFYQSFDGLIQDNIARSGDLLRQAMEMRETATREIAAAQAETERRRSEERSRYRILFSAMLDELTSLQGQAERLARRLTDALDEIETDLPPGTAAPSLAELDLGDDDLLAQTLALDAGLPVPVSNLGVETIDVETAVPETSPEPEPEESPPVAADADDAQAEHEDPLVGSEIPDSAPVAVSDVEEASPQRFGTTQPLTPPADPAEETVEEIDIPLEIRPFAPEDLEQHRHFVAGNDLALQPAVDPDQALPPPPTSPVSATIVLVHGVPRATTALSLKRYLEGLAHVGAVEPREFAEGILRLEVSGDRPLAFDDLRSWSEGAGLEPVHLRDDLVEVRLSP